MADVLPLRVSGQDVFDKIRKLSHGARGPNALLMLVMFMQRFSNFVTNVAQSVAITSLRGKNYIFGCSAVKATFVVCMTAQEGHSL